MQGRTFVCKSSLCMVRCYACFCPRYSHYSYYQCRAFDISAVGTTFNVFNYDAVWAEHRNPSPFQRLADTLCVLPRTRVLQFTVIDHFLKNPSLNFCKGLPKGKMFCLYSNFSTDIPLISIQLVDNPSPLICQKYSTHGSCYCLFIGTIRSSKPPE